jgi:hypothetical protein
VEMPSLGRNLGDGRPAVTIQRSGKQ